MNSAKALTAKKTLVRHPDQPLPQIRIDVPSKTSGPKVPADCSNTNIPGKETHHRNAKTTFNVPEMHSTLKLSKKIDDIVKPKDSKRFIDVDKGERAVDERVSRKVNFPYSQPVFKDLIPLTNNEQKMKPSIVIKGNTYQKDDEPILSDFLQARQQRKYYHKPRINMGSTDRRKIDCTNHGLSLYRILQINES